MVIGGEENIGNGWKMLMEALSSGECLPASGGTASKVHLLEFIIILRLKQFKMPLANMEAIQQKFINMIFNTWIIQSGVSLTNDILDSGNS